MGQIMLSLGAMALLSTIILSMNRSFLAADKDTLKSEVGITAVSLATSIIEEASGKAYDKNTDTTTIISTASLTPVNALGPESGEVYPNFNDFDDYKGLDITRSIDRSGTFRIRAAVYYISPTNPGVAAGSPTWNKRLTVTVTSPSMVDTIRMDYVFSYFYFR